MNTNFRYGENLFAQKAQLLNYEVTNLANDKNYFSKDIDFKLTNPKTNQTRYIEVKWDSRISATNNLYIEVSSINSKGGKGWFRFTEADYIAYGDAAAEQFHFFALSELKDYIKRNTCKSARCGSDSEGCLVPLSAVQNFSTYRLI